MGNVRGLLLEQLRKDGASLDAAYELVLDTLMDEIEVLESDAEVHQQAGRQAATSGLPDVDGGGGEGAAADSSSSTPSTEADGGTARLPPPPPPPDAPPLARMPSPSEASLQRWQRWERERRRSLARFFVLPVFVKDEEVICAPRRPIATNDCHRCD